MSRIENTREVSAIYCDCKKCFHLISKNSILYCQYYDIFSPKKKKCIRYSFLEKGKMQNKSPRDKLKKEEKKPAFPWERQ